MSQQCIDAVAAISSAMTSLHLYGDTHPSARLHADRAAELLNHGMRPNKTQRIILMPDAVAVGNTPMPKTGELSQRLQPLKDLGIDCILVARGVRGDELLALARSIVNKARPQKTSHLEFAAVRANNLDLDLVAGICAVANSESNRQRLEETWLRIQRGDGADERLWSAIGDITASATHSAGSLIPLAALKHHDQYTFVHTINVAILSTALARAAGATGQMLSDITAGALLHDVGKRLVPHKILNKPDALTKGEIEVVRRHPSNGAELLIGAPEVPDLASVIAYEHHMDLDGGGYPKRPASWRIGMASQIVHIADVFDALRTDRPYRKALEMDRALEIMEMAAGKSYDADLFDTFVTRVAHKVGVREEPDAQLQMAA